VVERYRYEPFGKVAIENASGQPLAQSGFGNDRFFLGRTWDAEVGLYDVRARWYEPDLGAFLAPDPLGAVDSWNFYQYGLAAPSIFSDSSGRSVWDFVKGVAAGLGMGTWDLAVSVVGTGWDLIRHPIDTSKEIAEGFGELNDALLA
jgi:RHS repeat-associated protein